ncbi:MAG TPA: PQQ-binding-like beta-propeller repeat protein, partial [Gemmatimonadales bacterium]
AVLPTNIIKEPATYVEGQLFMGRRTQPPGQRLAQPPPTEPPVIPGPGRRGRGPDVAVLAISSLTGDQAWRVTVKTAGILTTASNVLFTGDRDGYFRALDARTGRELWKVLLASAGLGTFMSPMTYAVNGRQYVSIVVGNGLFTFRLQD